MALTDTDYVILNTEITTDPESLGYAGKTDPEVADLLNTIGLVAPAEKVDVGVLNGQELSMAVEITEYVALNAASRDGWNTILSAGDGQVDVDDQRVVDQIAAIWGAGTTTRANLLALKTRPCSRAETLFGRGVSIHHLDVAQARVI